METLACAGKVEKQTHSNPKLDKPYSHGISEVCVLTRIY